MVSRPEHIDHHPAPRSPVDWFFRNPATGKVVIFQWPNLPLAIYLVATLVRVLFHPAGTAGTVVTVIATVAILWWSGDEVLRGESPFRRVLGAVVLTATIIGLITG